MIELNNQVVLSIIVPIYNVEDYLDVCLRSVYAIEDMPVEIILINDGSTDNSIDIINDFLIHYGDKTVFIDQKNQGLSVARNKGLEVASGRYVLFVDSDDYIDPEKINIFVNYALEHNLDLVQGKAIAFNDSTKNILNMPKEIFKFPIYSGVEYLTHYCNLASIKLRNFRPEAWLIIYKKDLLNDNKLTFEPNMYYEDELFVPNVFLYSKRVKALDIPFYYYRTRENSITTTFTNKHVLSKAKLVYNFYLVLRKHHFYHNFLNGRIIGWCAESLRYVSFKQLVLILFLKNKSNKDTLYLVFLILKKVFRVYNNT